MEESDQGTETRAPGGFTGARAKAWVGSIWMARVPAGCRARMGREKKGAGESAGGEREVREMDREALLAWREAGGLE